MKFLLCILVLAIPGMSIAAIDPLSATGPQVADADNPVRRHPLIEVRFVLVRASNEEQDRPAIELDNERSAIVPLSLSDHHSVLLRAHYVNPNMYWCAAWGCMPGSY